MDEFIPAGDFFSLYLNGWPLQAYKGKDGKLRLLIGLDGMNDFFRSDVRSPKIARELVSSDKFPWIALSAVSVSDARIVTVRLMANLTADADSQVRTLAKRFAFDPRRKLSGNYWTIEFNVYGGDGSVEGWSLSGFIFPLEVQALDRKELLSPGVLPGFRSKPPREDSRSLH